MTKLLSGIAALASIVSVAPVFAADLPVKAPRVVPMPVYGWAGFYVGANAGYGWSNSNINTSSVETFSAPTWNTENDASTALASGSNPANNNGFIGGGQIGYNWQFANWVAGVEADIQGIASNSSTSSRSGSLVPVGFPGELIVSTATASKSIDYLGTVRGRIGTLVTPTFLAYATGGLAYGGVSASTNIVQENRPFAPAFSSSGHFSDTRVGWTVGGGVEWMFAPNWSAKAEYLFYDLGSVTYADSPLSFGANYTNVPHSTTRFDGNIVRVGVNYHFN